MLMENSFHWDFHYETCYFKFLIKVSTIDERKIQFPISFMRDVGKWMNSKNLTLTIGVKSFQGEKFSIYDRTFTITLSPLVLNPKARDWKHDSSLVIWACSLYEEKPQKLEGKCKWFIKHTNCPR